MTRHLESIADWEHRAEAARYQALALARQCGVSRRQLRRYFFANFGLAPKRWLEGLRLERAAALLRGGRSLKVVAFTLGFKNCSHLSAAFKIAYRIGPHAFSERCSDRPSWEI